MSAEDEQTARAAGVTERPEDFVFPSPPSYAVAEDKNGDLVGPFLKVTWPERPLRGRYSVANCDKVTKKEKEEADQEAKQLAARRSNSLRRKLLGGFILPKGGHLRMAKDSSGEDDSSSNSEKEAAASPPSYAVFEDVKGNLVSPFLKVIWPARPARGRFSVTEHKKLAAQAGPSDEAEVEPTDEEVGDEELASGYAMDKEAKKVTEKAKKKDKQRKKLKPKSGKDIFKRPDGASSEAVEGPSPQFSPQSDGKSVTLASVDSLTKIKTPLGAPSKRKDLKPLSPPNYFGNEESPTPRDGAMYATQLERQMLPGTLRLFYMKSVKDTKETCPPLTLAYKTPSGKFFAFGIKEVAQADGSCCFQTKFRFVSVSEQPLFKTKKSLLEFYTWYLTAKCRNCVATGRAK